MPRATDYSPEFRAAVCTHVIAQLSQQQLDQLSRGETVRFEKGCQGDPKIDEAFRQFKQSMRRDARAGALTRKQCKAIAVTWMHKYDRMGQDGLRSIRKKRAIMTQAEWQEASDILCTPVEHSTGLRLWRSVAECLHINHAMQERFR